MPNASTRSVFILSFRQRDELAATATRAGWRAVAARRADGIERRVAAAGAPVVVIDARGALAEGLEAVRGCAGALAGAGRALLVLVSRGDDGALDDFYTAGATHFLASPMREPEFAAALAFAGRYAERLAGGWVSERGGAHPLGWRYDGRQRSLQLTPALARQLGVAEEGRPGRVLARLDRDLRRPLAAALTRLGGEGTAAFAHDHAALGRVVHHLSRDSATGRTHAVIEPLGRAPDPAGETRDLFPRRSRSLADLARDLPGGIDRDEIEVRFQPQVRIADGVITGVEALARWQHPRLGEVGAEALIAAAARAGLDDRLSAAIHARALARMAAWPAELAELRVSLNVTAGDLSAPDCAERLLARIDAAGVARSRVTIEVTESELIERLDVAADALSGLRDGGVATAIDDFGTGYSSLAYLAALPLDALKIDRALTVAIAREGRERVIVRGVIAMARALGLATVAEGVETDEQRALLAAEGCTTYQGYLCAPPLADAELVALVQAKR